MGTIIFWTCIGIFLGWVVVPQPAWAANVWGKITGLFSKKEA